MSTADPPRFRIKVAHRSLTPQGPAAPICGSSLSDQSVIAKYGGGIAFSIGAIRSFEKEGGAHQPNEYVECDRLVELSKAVAAFILRKLDH